MAKRERKPLYKAKTGGRSASEKMDAFANAITGIGDATRDKRTGGATAVNEITKGQADELYRGDALGAVIVEALPDEMLRTGFEVVIEGDEELSEECNAFLDELDVCGSLLEALYWARKDGGAGIFLGAEDGATDLEQPLDLTKIQSLEFLSAFTRWELVPRYYYANPILPKYGRPSVFQLQGLFGLPASPRASADPSNVRGTPNTKAAAALGASSASGLDPAVLSYVHESRLLTFEGVKVTRDQRIKNNGWGDSVYVRVFEVLRDFNLSWGGACNLLSDFAQAVAYLNGLNEMILAEDDDVTMKRAQLFDLTRSVARMVVLDAGDKDGTPPEKFERQVANLTGLPEMMQQLALNLAAAARMPVSLLMGQAPAGLNATGDADIRWYYDRIDNHRQKELLKPLKYLCSIMFAAKDGPTKGVTPPRWSVRFPELWQLDGVQEAARRLSIAQADVAYVGVGVVSPEEVAASRFGGSEYSAETTVDMAAREAHGPTPEDRQKAATAGVEQEKNPPDPLEMAKANAKNKPPPSKK